MADKDYTIFEGYSLPSKGEIYDKPFDPKVELRSMTVREEARRLAPTNLPLKKLCDIIQDCLIHKLPVNVYDLCLGDYNYLLHKLRVVTYGPEYRMMVKCPFCKTTQEQTYSLDKLKIKEFDTKKFFDSLSFTLPVSQKRIKIKYQTPRMLDDIEVKKADWIKHSKVIDTDPTMLITLQCLIDEVDGNKLSYLQKEEFITSLSAKDALYILQKSSQSDEMIGLDTSIDLSCSKCGEEILLFFREGPEFLRPNLIEEQ